MNISPCAADTLIHRQKIQSSLIKYYYLINYSLQVTPLLFLGQSCDVNGIEMAWNIEGKCIINVLFMRKDSIMLTESFHSQAYCAISLSIVQ
jgi:hypothetical protein